MKTTIIATTLALASLTAHSQEARIAELKSEICANEAHISVLIVRRAHQGASWESIEKAVNQGLRPGALADFRRVYHTYTSFDEATIRNLAFTNCEIAYLKK